MAKVVVFICLIAFGTCAVRNVHDQMYLQLEANTTCVLRLNGSQTFGCTSSRSGNVGVVHLVYNSTNLNWVLTSAPMDSYIVVLNLEMFSFENLQKLNSSDRITGVLLIQNVSRSDISNFSPEDTCPNRYSGLAAPPNGYDVCESQSQPWNPRTKYLSISMHKWKMPIFFTDNPESIKQVEWYFWKFNMPLETQSERSLCALQLSAYMNAAIDSPTCMRRSDSIYNSNPMRFCDPLGDDNIWVPVIPFSKSAKPKKYIVVAARLDSTSLFYGRTPGALSTATSLVTLLSTAHLLFQMTSSSQNVKQNVLFMLFNGEAYDYIGSSRVVYDMERGKFPFEEHPIRLDDISLFIELSQLRNNKSVIYHSLKSPDSEMSNFVRIFDKKANNYGITTSSSSSRSHFPPASFQSFLAKNENMSGFVFSSYGDQFNNRYYHSLYDDALNVDYKYMNGSHIEDDSLQSFVANFSTALAHSLFEEMTDLAADSGPASVNPSQVDEILHCYLNSALCKFAQSVDYTVDSEHQKLNYYVGVNYSTAAQEVAVLTWNALIHLMGRPVRASSDECNSKLNSTHYTNSYWSPATNQCLESAANKSDAVSPAFLIENYDLAEGLYSSWTESTWQNFDVRMFLQPSAKYEWCCGVLFQEPKKKESWIQQIQNEVERWEAEEKQGKTWSQFKKELEERRSEKKELEERGADKKEGDGLVAKVKTQFQTRLPRFSTFFFLVRDGAGNLTTDIMAMVPLYYNLVRNQRTVQDFNLRELELLYEVYLQIQRMVPICIFVFVPLGNIAVFCAAYMKPLRFLTPHFWSDEQKATFIEDQHKNRVAVLLPIIQYLEINLPEEEDSKLVSEFRDLLLSIQDGGVPSPSELVSFKDLFGIEQIFAVEKVSSSHLSNLLTLHGQRGFMMKKNWLDEWASYLHLVDEYIKENGGVTALSSEQLKKYCFQRGVNANLMTEEEMQDYLSQWIAFSENISSDYIGLLLHAPALIGFNHKSNQSVTGQSKDCLL